MRREGRRGVRRLRSGKHALGRKMNDACANHPAEGENHVSQLPAEPAALRRDRGRCWIGSGEPRLQIRQSESAVPSLPVSAIA